MAGRPLEQGDVLGITVLSLVHSMVRQVQAEHTSGGDCRRSGGAEPDGGHVVHSSAVGRLELGTLGLARGLVLLEGRRLERGPEGSVAARSRSSGKG